MKSQSDESPIGCAKYLFGVAIAAMALSIIIAIAFSGDEPEPVAAAPAPVEKSEPKPAQAPTSYGRDDAMAWVMCQDFLESRLQAPSTAKYPWSYSDKVRYLGDSRYRIRSYFDAQNGFGAMIRGNFDCTIKQTGREEWTLEDLQIR